MAINAHHPFEELDGVKCSVVEKNCSPDRVSFLKAILENNSYKVVIAKSPPPKTAAKPAADGAPVVEAPPAPETFSVGVTDLMFNSTNAIFGRLLRTTDGHVVTRAYWMQEEKESHDEIPYFQKS